MDSHLLKSPSYIIRVRGFLSSQRYPGSLEWVLDEGNLKQPSIGKPTLRITDPNKVKIFKHELMNR